jgi:hypothetical protein
MILEILGNHDRPYDKQMVSVPGLTGIHFGEAGRAELGIDADNLAPPSWLGISRKWYPAQSG